MKKTMKSILVFTIAMTLFGACAIPAWARAETDKNHEQILAETPEDAYLCIAIELNNRYLLPDFDWEGLRRTPTDRKDRHDPETNLRARFGVERFERAEPILREYMVIEYPLTPEQKCDFYMVWGYAKPAQIRQLVELPEVAYLGICSYLIENLSVRDFRPASIDITPRYSTILCDVDLNGTINARDARLALRASAKLENLSPIRFFAADLNGDGRITAGEARKILRVGAGLEPFLFIRDPA